MAAPFRAVRFPGYENGVFASIVGQVADERDRQEAKWGHQDNSHLQWLAILEEEVGEVAKEIFFEPSNSYVEEEIIQVMAVCAAWLENRRETRYESLPGSDVH
jgi:NTP pyrophosphatase (non-canonical NTP hydrolase)